MLGSSVSSTLNRLGLDAFETFFKDYASLDAQYPRSTDILDLPSRDAVHIFFDGEAFPGWLRAYEFGSIVLKSKRKWKFVDRLCTVQWFSVVFPFKSVVLIKNRGKTEAMNMNNIKNYILKERCMNFHIMSEEV